MVFYSWGKSHSISTINHIKDRIDAVLLRWTSDGARHQQYDNADINSGRRVALAANPLDLPFALQYGHFAQH